MTSRFKLLVVTSSSCLAVLLLMGAMLGQSAAPEDAYRQLAVYTEVLAKIKSDYVEDPDIKSVTLGALNGLLESIDPYASYLSADQYKQYVKEKDAHKGDVGLVVSKRYGYIGIVGVVPGSPGAKAGLGTGDLLETIRGVTTRDMPLAYAELMLRGEVGSAVELGVLRFRRPEPQAITLTRAILKAPAVTRKMLPDGIGYIQVPTTQAGKSREVAAALAELENQGARKLVLDVRGSALGEPAEGIAIADLFLNKGLITYLQGQRVTRQNFEAEASRTVWGHPTVVIVNRGTAGGAEIVASALLDHKRAEVVGERTYGDAALRKPVLLDDGAAVILSVAKYYSPSAKAIQDHGVTPSVPMAESEPTLETDDDTERLERPERKSEEDRLLKRAIEVLTQTVERAASGR
jgi:carboxyl-terminal processing protease